MPSPLRCPTCSAPLDLPPEHATVARCTYCGAGVLLTERGGQVHAAAQQERHTDAIAQVLRHLHAGDRLGAIRTYREHFDVGLAEATYAVERIEAGQPGGPTASPFRTDSAPATRSAAPSPSRGRPVLAAALLLALAGGGVFAIRGRGSETATPPGQAPSPRPEATSPLARLRRGELAEPVLRFGAQGTGAGRFEDARSVAVDGAGRIYVAEYSGGRVQVFDGAGNFVTQWMADTRMPLRDMEADRGGTVYIVQRGGIHRYEGATGRALGDLPRPAGTSIDDVKLALDGTFWAVTTPSQILHLDRDGSLLKTIDVRQAVDEDASPERLAVSGTGDLYVIDQWTGEVYHLDANGRFKDRFGGRPEDPREEGMGSPADLAIDGRGRVFVSDAMDGFFVFDADGRFIERFGRELNPFGITFNDRDELFATNRNDHEVIKFRLAR